MVRRRFVLALMIVALMTVIPKDGGASAQSPPQGKTALPKTTGPNISGTWSLIATHKGPPGMPDGVSFRATVAVNHGVMEESKPTSLDGYVTFQDRSEGAFMGIVSDKGVTFTTVLKNPDRPSVTQIADFTGTLDGEKTIKGHVIRVSTEPGTYMRGEGSFVATRR